MARFIVGIYLLQHATNSLINNLRKWRSKVIALHFSQKLANFQHFQFNNITGSILKIRMIVIINTVL